MKSFLCLVCLLLIASAILAAEGPKAPQVDFPERPHFNLKLLSPSERHNLEALKPGMTRQQLAEHFDQDGGLIFYERYFLSATRLRRRHNPNTVVMVDFVFKPASMDEATFADQKRSAAWFRNHPHWFPGQPNDIVKAFSKPYESGIAID